MYKSVFSGVRSYIVYLCRSCYLSLSQYISCSPLCYHAAITKMSYRCLGKLCWILDAWYLEPELFEVALVFCAEVTWERIRSGCRVCSFSGESLYCWIWFWCCCCCWTFNEGADPDGRFWACEGTRWRLASIGPENSGAGARFMTRDDREDGLSPACVMM